MKKIVVTFLSVIIAFSVSTVVLAANHAMYQVKTTQQVIQLDDDPYPVPVPDPVPTPEPVPEPVPEPAPAPEPAPDSGPT